jgi:thiol-disulfide isomerase/thioredoxin
MLFLHFLFFVHLFGGDFKQNKSTDIVLIFHSTPVNKSVKLADGSRIGSGGKYEVIYVDQSSISHFINPIYGSESDTFKLYSKDDCVEVEHIYRGVDRLTYLFKRGDSVDIFYKGIKPVVRLRNRAVNFFDLNFELYLRERVYHDDFPSVYLYKDPYLARLKLPKLQSLDAVRKELRKRIYDEYSSELLVLDSLRKHAQISLPAYNYFKCKINFEVKTFDLTSGKKGALEKAEEEVKTNDRLLGFSFFRRFLHSYIAIKNAKNVKLVRSNNGVTKDYKALYRLIGEDQSLTLSLKKYLLRDCVEKIFEYGSNRDGYTFFETFNATFNDLEVKTYLTDKYLLSEKLTTELRLTDVNDNTFQFASILAANKGKFIYMDFWASWCVPCMKSMPASVALSKRYQSKNIQFVYVSVDDNKAAWKKANERTGLVLSKSSYIIQNKHSSSLLDELKVESIPRYVIFDDQGKVVYLNAPDPSDVRLIGVLDQLVGQF